MHIKIVVFVCFLSMHSNVQPMWLLNYLKNNDAKIECLNNDVLKEIFKILAIPKTKRVHDIRSASHNFKNISATCKKWKSILDKIEIPIINDKGEEENILLNAHLVFLMNRIKEVNQPFSKDDDITPIQKWHHTPLTYAIGYLSFFDQNSLKVVENMLNDCHEVNQRDSCDKTPLYYAIANGHTEMVQLLLDYGASPYNIDIGPCSATKNGNAFEIALFLNCYDRGSKAGVIKAKYPELDPANKHWCTTQ